METAPSPSIESNVPPKILGEDERSLSHKATMLRLMRPASLVAISLVAVWKLTEFIFFENEVTFSTVFDLVLLSLMAPIFVWVVTKFTVMLVDCAYEGNNRYVDNFETVQREMRERKKVVPALVDSSNLYEILYMEAPHAYFCATPEGIVQTANKSAEKLLGRPIDELIGMHVLEFYADNPNGKAKAMNLRAKAEDGGLVSREELQVHRVDGSPVWVELSVHPVFDENGGLISSLGMAVDVSQRKEAEAEQQRLVEELRDALANIKTLSGLLPICANCKKVRDDTGYWSQIESYISDNSEADISHSICPPCFKVLYPDYTAPSETGQGSKGDSAQPS